MAKLALALALVLAAGCKESGGAGPVPQPTRAPPAGFEDVDTAERPDAGPAEAPAREADRRSKPRGDGPTPAQIRQDQAALESSTRGRSPPRTR